MANEDVSSSKSVTDSNQNSDTATEEKFIKALGLDKLDLSDEQLKNLGLDRNTFLRNGVKYKAVASFEVFTLDGKHYTYSIKPFHTANGDLDERTGTAVREKLLNDFDAIYNAGILDASYTARLAPYLQGKTIYINKGHELTDQDARRGLPDKYANGYKNVTWDKQLPQKQVNVNIAGTYTGAVDVVYDSEVGVSTDVEVNVVDPKGQDTTVHINQPVPNPGTTVIPNTYPTGSTITWVTQPDTSKPGPQKVTVIITYPDGTKSNPVETTVTVIDDTIKKHQQVGTITMIEHVHFVEQDNENVDLAPETTQTIKFIVYADTKNGQVIDGTISIDPTSNKFPRVLPKEIAGYTVIPVEADGIAEQTIIPTVNTSGLTETVDFSPLYIHYTKNPAQPTTPANPSNPTEPTTPVNPSNPTQPTSQPTTAPVLPEQPTTPAEPTTPSKPDEPDDVETVRPLPQNHKNKGNNNNIIARSYANHVAKSHSDQHALAAANKLSRKLPQTGSKQNGFVAAIGAAIAAVGSLFGLAGRRKKY